LVQFTHDLLALGHDYIHDRGFLDSTVGEKPITSKPGEAESGSAGVQPDKE
jgi:hypothetical protein